MEIQVIKSLQLKELTQEEKREYNKRVRENNKMARDLGYARGVKQMIEEGAI